MVQVITNLRQPQLLSFIKTDEEKKKVIERIKRKFSQIPNTGHMDIWLQRVTLPLTKDIHYHEPICELVNGVSTKIWNVDWISAASLKEAVNARNLVDMKVLREIEPIIPSEEVELFITKATDGYYS